MRQVISKKQIIQPLDQLLEDEIHFKDSVKDFAINEVEPLIYEMDIKAQLDKALREKINKAGLMKIEIEKAYGGAGNTFMHSILAIEALAETDPAVAVYVDVQNTLVINAITKWGTSEQKDKYLSALASGSVGAFSITEKESGSDAVKLKCSAEKVIGGYRINGVKHWVTNAAEANIFIIFAKINDSSKKVFNEASLTAFLIDKTEVTGMRVAQPEQKMGIRSSSTCDVYLDDVYVDDNCVLGNIGRGLMIAVDTLTDGRIGISAQMLGLAQGAFNYAVNYSKERKQFGEYICTYQGIHFPIAQMAAELQAVRLCVYNAARKRIANCDFKELMLHASIAKLSASQAAERIVSQSLEIVGGNGYMKNNPIEKLYRDAKIGAIYEGTSNIQLQTIAKNFVRVK